LPKQACGGYIQRECTSSLQVMAISDLCDVYAEQVRDGKVRVLPPGMFQIYGSRRAFSGSIATVKVLEDNVMVREMLEEDGQGRVLVVDGGANLPCALLGGNLVVLAHTNGWSGIVLNGNVRDVDEINNCDIGVRALAAHPVKSSKNKKACGEKNGVLTIGGTAIIAGEWCYADSDGIIISPSRLSI
ncbi:hypothetical protein KI387_000871, partial [Taxus chinensis]